MRQFWNITSGNNAKYHVQIMLLFVLYSAESLLPPTTHKRIVIFTCRYFKLNWNITALSQSNCRNFSSSSIKFEIMWNTPLELGLSKALVYSYFEEGCRKSTRQSRKALWVVLSSLFFKESIKCIDYIPYCLSGLSRAHFFRQPFSK